MLIKDKKYNFLVAAIFFILFSIVTILVLNNQTTEFDEVIYNYLSNNRNSFLDTFFINFTHIGDTLPVVILAIILFFVFKEKGIIATSFILCTGINTILKHLIVRERPPLVRRLITQGGYSYPSGHSIMALCTYGILIYFVITKIKKKWLKILLTILLSLMILLIGISRIYVGVHYPSDVLGAFLLGIVILIVNITLINYYFKGE